jgi:hypothetical protein
MINVDAMLESISYIQFVELMTYFKEVGFEVDNAEIRKAEIMATLINLQRIKSSDRVYKVSDFIRKRFDSESKSDVDTTGTKLDVLKAMLTAKR